MTPQPRFTISDLPAGSRKDPSRTGGSFASKLLAIRGYYGLTQAEVAFQAGVSDSAIQMIECDERVPSTQTVYRILVALGVMPDSAIVAIALTSPTQPHYFAFTPSKHRLVDLYHI